MAKKSSILYTIKRTKLVLKVYDLIFKVGYKNIIISGFKVSLIAWIGMLINECYHVYKNKSTNK